jgi:hypothetical protein
MSIDAYWHGNKTAVGSEAASAVTYPKLDRWRMRDAKRATAIQKAEEQQCGTRRVKQENGRQMSVLGCERRKRVDG